ncbi:zinc finger matrin-type 2-like [Chlorella sorokiniana]|uniref:Zinc finger matrin-type 2-like n=1 Tax=Chlorella sorokiniana TaxID=3076 RepID=A0A2P6U4E2_CHLSO|nr:zinc finger matrin-type 2-like [Chlorella sorokiniana]|eukprot:PRW61183.1 zinc finger matrin-type 2-like [Chlorella sorokiniana]
MSGKSNPKGVVNTFRRTWDKEEYREKAEEREKEEAKVEDEALALKKRKRLERDPLHQGLIVARANLKARDYQIDLAAKLNKTQMVSVAMPLSQQAGYYCNVCDCVLRDSQSYLDHINGKWHNRALGMSMRVEKSTAEQVRQRLEEAKKRKEGGSSSVADFAPDGFEQLAQKEAAKEEERRSGKRRRGGSDGEDNDEEEDVDPEMAALMGFGGFGTSKK